MPRLHRELRRYRHGKQWSRDQLKGDPIDPMSQGRICPKGISGVQALYHPNLQQVPAEARGREARQSVGAHQLGRGRENGRPAHD